MNFTTKEWTIQDLMKSVERKNLNLNPPYQRNDIWAPIAKRRLIDTIEKGYPLPAFFIHKKQDLTFDMVDGQQRSRTLIAFKEAMFTDLEKRKFDEIDQDHFYNYTLTIIEISELDEDKESMEELYYRINKFGTKLNRPEILKVQYFDNPLQKLIEKLASTEDFQRLNLFTESNISRMLDYDFIGELLTLIDKGVTDKKIEVDRLYEEDLSDKKLKNLENQFNQILSIFLEFNQIYEMKLTRYKQRNDFYTLFDIVKEIKDHVSRRTLCFFYKLLVLMGEDINPMNDECFALQDYAANCVSQSNSKRARLRRRNILLNILMNRDPEPLSNYNKLEEYDNEILPDVMEYYSLTDNDLTKIENYYTLPIEKLSNSKEEIVFKK